MPTGDTVHTSPLPDRYHVEIRHGDQWMWVHPPAWEHTEDLDQARAYAAQVEADEVELSEIETDRPDPQVRIMRTSRRRVQALSTGRVHELALRPEVHETLVL